jgi:hypothetical protein
MLTYRIIGSAVTEQIGDLVLDIKFVSNIFSHSNLQCISCITYDVFSSAILLYILSFHISGEPNTVKRFETVAELGTLKKYLSKALWIILFVLTKNVENAI